MSEGAESAPRFAWLASLRTARSAAIAGLIFAVLLTVTVFLLRTAFPMGAFINSTSAPAPDAIGQARFAITLIPYVGIAFLWFTAALNYNLGHADNRLFTTVFTGSGVAFVVVLFMIGAIAAGQLDALARGLDPVGVDRISSGTTINQLLESYAPRMAAVFTLALSTLGRLRKVFPTWLSVYGTVTGLILLLIPFGVRYVEYLFPLWAVVVSVFLLIHDPGGKTQQAPTTG